MQKSNKKDGFTLIELLVVISIIAVLMSILMPALRKVKVAAADTVCKSRMNQCGQAIQMYSAENYRLPTNCLTAGQDLRWYNKVASYVNRAAVSQTQQKFTASDYELFRCPTQDYLTKLLKEAIPDKPVISPLTGKDLHSAGTGQGIYGYNWYLTGDGVAERNWTRMEQINQPSSFVILADLTAEAPNFLKPINDVPGAMFYFTRGPNPKVYANGVSFTNRSKYDIWAPAPNHGKHINYAFADGGVRRLENFGPWDDVDTMHESKADFFHPKRNALIKAPQ